MRKLSAAGPVGCGRAAPSAILKAAVLDDYQGVAYEIVDWAPVAGRVEVTSIRRHLAGAELVEAVRDCAIVVTMRERTRFDRSLLGALPSLRLLVTTGPFNRSIDIGAARALGIDVCGTRSNSDSAAELTIGLILSLCRGIHLGHAQLSSTGAWQPFLGHGVAGKRLGIVGLGQIGLKVAFIARALDMEVLAWSQNLSPETCAAHAVGYAPSKEQLLEASDIVTLHLVLSDRTRGIIGAADIARMKAEAYLVNTSRGPLVDEDALLSALRQDRIAGAALDVFDIEPLPPQHPMRTAPRVLLTPHIGYVTWDNYRMYFHDVVEDIAAWLKGRPLRCLA